MPLRSDIKKGFFYIVKHLSPAFEGLVEVFPASEWSEGAVVEFNEKEGFILGDDYVISKESGYGVKVYFPEEAQDWKFFSTKDDLRVYLLKQQGRLDSIYED